MRDELGSSSAIPLYLLTWKTNRSHEENIYLIALSNLADNFSCCWIDRREGFLTDCIMPFVIYENLQRIKQSSVNAYSQT